MALHNMDTAVVELYNWTTIYTAEGVGVNRTYDEMSASLFLSEEISMDYIFVGWTIDSKQIKKHTRSFKPETQIRKLGVL